MFRGLRPRPGSFPKSLPPPPWYQSLRADSLWTHMSVWTSVWLFLNHNIFVALQRWQTQERVCPPVYVCMYAPCSSVHMCVYGADRGYSRACRGLKLLLGPSQFSSLCSFIKTAGCCTANADGGWNFLQGESKIAKRKLADHFQTLVVNWCKWEDSELELMFFYYSQSTSTPACFTVQELPVFQWVTAAPNMSCNVIHSII